MPGVSIITAAYNRSNVLHYAIKSVLGQTFTDWEHIIIGDHCTDDTEAVIAGFDDPRLIFRNLQSNSGGQAAPHNCALTMAKGDYLFFLNQDDIFFPDHVVSNVAFLERTGADLVWSATATPVPGNRSSADWRDQRIMLGGVPATERFDPEIFIIASSWAMRRATAERLGPWKHENETTLQPSREYIFRAWKAGYDIRFHRHISVLCVLAGDRTNSYATRDYLEQKRYYNLLFDEPNGRVQLLEHIALSIEAVSKKQQTDSLRKAIRSGFKSLYLMISGAFGLHPHVVSTLIRNRRFGGFVAKHRRVVFDVPIVRVGDHINFSHVDADQYLGIGWAPPERDDRLMIGPIGQMAFRIDAASRPKRMLINGAPIAPHQVEFQLSGQKPIQIAYEDGKQSAEIPLPETGDIISLTIALIEVSGCEENAAMTAKKLPAFTMREITFC